MKKLNVVVLTALVLTAGMAANVKAEDYNYKRTIAQAAPADSDDPYEARASKTGYWILGGGAAVNSLPISASKFTLPLVYVAYESISKKSLGDFDSSWSFGLYDLMPEIEFGMTIPAKPFDFRFSAGGFYDVIIGGMFGVLCKAGVIINKSVEFDLMFIPIGSQPTVSYSESLAQQHIVENDGSHGLKFPVFGVLLGFRI